MVARVLERLAALGCEATRHDTTGPGDARWVAAQISRTDYDAIVVAGGDGTINEVVNGLTPQAPALAIVPAGTANVFASEIGLADDPDRIADTIATGASETVYAASVGERLFLQMAGIGFDATVVDTVDLGLKRRIGKGAYVWQSLRLLGNYAFPRFTLTIDGTAFDVGSAIVANGRLYGGHYVCAPAASPFRADLEICMFLDGGPIATLDYGRALIMGRLPTHRRFRIVSGREVAIAGPKGAPIQTDGEIVGRVPAIIRGGAAAIEVICGRSQAD